MEVSSGRGENVSFKDGVWEEAYPESLVGGSVAWDDPDELEG